MSLAVGFVFKSLLCLIQVLLPQLSCHFHFCIEYLYPSPHFTSSESLISSIGTDECCCVLFLFMNSLSFDWNIYSISWHLKWSLIGMYSFPFVTCFLVVFVVVFCSSLLIVSLLVLDFLYWYGCFPFSLILCSYCRYLIYHYHGGHIYWSITISTYLNW